jgi:hypothetical protein
VQRVGRTCGARSVSDADREARKGARSHVVERGGEALIAMRANLSAVAPLAESAAAEISRPPEKLVFFEDLKPTYGIPYGRVYLYRLMRDGRFPLRVKVAARRRSAWIESETAANFDARFEVGEALARHELIARTATRRALAGDGDAAKWARVAVQATSARTQLLQDIGLIDRKIGTLFIDDGQRADRIPSGVELQAIFRDVSVTEDEITSEAEWHYQHGDAAAYDARAAVDGHSPDNRRTVPLKLRED